MPDLTDSVYTPLLRCDQPFSVVAPACSPLPPQKCVNVSIVRAKFLLVVSAAGARCLIVTFLFLVRILFFFRVLFRPSKGIQRLLANGAELGTGEQSSFFFFLEEALDCCVGYILSPTRCVASCSQEIPSMADVSPREGIRSLTLCPWRAIRSFALLAP